MAEETQVSADGHCWLVRSCLCMYRRTPEGETWVYAPRYREGRRVGWQAGVLRVYDAQNEEELHSMHLRVCGEVRDGTLVERARLLRLVAPSPRLAAVGALLRRLLS